MNFWKRWGWASPRQLRERGILGINARNCRFILPQNPRRNYPRVDDKLQTKAICVAHGIPAPETYAVIRRQGDVRRVHELVADHSEFVIKPAAGSEGRGIIVVAEHDAQQFVTPGGHAISLAEVRYHLSTILAGLYSLGGQLDCAILEQRIIRHPAFDGVAVGGTPDIRVILYHNVPVMAMVRLPTIESRGRANLHQGAIAAGIDLATGQTSGGVCQGRAVACHPDTGNSIESLAIPMWGQLLEAAVGLAQHLELGYVGVDFVLDASRGPVVLEANARPGLAIQVANRRGLQPRLDWVDRQPASRRRKECLPELIGELASME